MTPRVVVLTPYFRPIVGGVESNAERLARYLHADGFDVRVLTKRVTRKLPDTETVGGVPVERVGPFGERSPAGKWLIVPFATTWLIQHAASHDVVCCVDYRGVGLAVLAARAVTHRPVVFQAQTTGVLSGDNADVAFTRWGLNPRGRLARLVKSAVRASYGRADAYACISREIEREMLRAGIPRDRVHFLPNAIDMTRFRPASDEERAQSRRDLDFQPDRVVCVFIGRLSWEKGLMDLMEAWRLLRPANALLVVVGPDMDGHAWNVGPAAREFAARHRLLDSTRFLGSVADVAPLLRAADVMVQPSHFEAQGLSAVEALASGVPVVATAVGGLLDFVVDGRNGRFCPPQDAQALAVALRTLIEDPVLRRRLAANARLSVEAEYDERIVFARFARLLKRLVGAAA